MSLVLCSLISVPYKLLKEDLNRCLFYKTAFLLAINSAKRVGELYGFYVNYSEGWISRLVVC